jgi:hypothetical protein
MRSPMMARYRSTLYTMLAAGGMLLAACARDVTAPSASTLRASPERVSSFRPSAASRALYGVSDGVYTMSFDPSQDQSFNLGLNHLELPANAVCNLADSSYGPDYWNDACTPQTDSVTITVTITGAETDKPRIDFQPAMRFSPDANVQLFMFAPNASLSDSWKLGYCNDENVCVDESVADSALQSYVDHAASVVFRRIKHFSGYIVVDGIEVPQDSLPAFP